MNKQENENKRKRGRPRKRPLDENVSTTPKKRGRPKKEDKDEWFDEMGNRHCITIFGDEIILPF